MSLRRQLIIIISALLMVLFVATLTMSTGNMRSYIASQLESHAQDAATSLGLSLQPYFVKGDVATMETMVNAIFDSGYYRSIVISDSSGKTLIKREREVKIDGVPQWFVSAVPLEAPTMSSIISAGWKPGGQLSVSSHPGYAYIELWKNVTETFWWFSGALLVSIFLTVMVLHFVLSPLRAVEKQALAIAQRQFPVQKNLPWTRELRTVVIAMNKMSAKVERIITEQAQTAEKMRKQAFEDPLTGLGNRRNFDLHLDFMVSSKDEVAYGALIILQIDNFAEYNKKHGYEAGDSLLKEVGEILHEQTKDLRNATVARIGGAEFAILVADTTVEDAEGLGKLISYGLGQVKAEGMERGLGHIGIGYYSVDLSASSLLSQADMALRHAMTKGPNAWHLYEDEALSKTDVKSASDWGSVIEDVIENKSVSLLFQKAQSIQSGKSIHYEALARISRSDGSLVPAAVFMPMVEKLKLTTPVDKILVEKLIETASADKSGNYSINLFSHSAHSEEFIDWLVNRLSKNLSVARRIAFELSEYGAIFHCDEFKSATDRISSTGANVILDNFGSSSTSFGYLRDLRLKYLKLDGSYIKDLAENMDNQLFVKAITEIAHGLDIEVIAKSVENQEELDALKDLNVDGAQGYFIAKPGEITS